MFLDDLTNAFPAFRFIVTVDAIPYGVFTECSVPNIEWNLDEVKEGGLNHYTHQLLGRRGKTRFTLKNGVGTSLLISWFLMVMADEFLVTVPGTSKKVSALRRTVTIMLLSSLHIPIMTWNIFDAMPVKWTGPQLSTKENNIAVQTLEFIGGEVVPIPGISF